MTIGKRIIVPGLIGLILGIVFTFVVFFVGNYMLLNQNYWTTSIYIIIAFTIGLPYFLATWIFELFGFSRDIYIIQIFIFCLLLYALFGIAIYKIYIHYKKSQKGINIPLDSTKKQVIYALVFVMPFLGLSQIGGYLMGIIGGGLVEHLEDLSASYCS